MTQFIEGFMRIESSYRVLDHVISTVISATNSSTSSTSCWYTLTHALKALHTTQPWRLGICEICMMQIHVRIFSLVELPTKTAHGVAMQFSKLKFQSKRQSFGIFIRPLVASHFSSNSESTN